MAIPCNLEDFTATYIEAIYFTDTGEDEQPANDILMHPDAKKRAEDECAAFLWRVYPFLDHAARATDTDRHTLYMDAARDFWLTRNGHGVGFWDDSRWPVSGHTLDNVARSFGSVDTYETDCGKLDTM